MKEGRKEVVSAMESNLIFRKEDIQKFLVLYFGLHKLDTFGSGKEGILNFVSKVGCLQYDPLDIVGKNAELMIQARFNVCSPKILYELLYKDRCLIDSFDKEASIILSSDWAKFDRIRKKMEEKNCRVLKYRQNEEALQHLEEVLSFVKGNRNTCSKDIHIAGGKKGRWGSSNITNCALYHLWCQGNIRISNRKGSTKFYTHCNDATSMQAKNECFSSFMEWYVLRRLNALGLYWLKKRAGWQGFFLEDLSSVTQTMQRLVATKQVIKIHVETLKEAFFMSTFAYQELMASLDKKLDESIRFIAPLDNFIWDRQLISKLFDFDYTWEVYVPENKRKYGYYVLPILYKHTFIGRVEPSRDKDRKEKFKVKHIWFEKESYQTTHMHHVIHEEIKRYNKFMKDEDGEKMEMAKPNKV